MLTTKLIHVAAIPIGLDVDISKTLNLVKNKWKNSDHGQWVSAHALNIKTDIEDMIAEQGMRVNIYAEFDEDHLILYKLTYGNRLVER